MLTRRIRQAPSDLTTSDVKVKGHALNQQQSIIRELLTPPEVERFDAELSESIRALALTPVLPSGWYPVDWVENTYRAGVAVSAQARDLPERVARESIRRDVNGLYRFVARLLSPEYALSHVERVVHTYLRGPQVSVQNDGPGHVTLRWSHCSGIGRLHWRDIIASVSAVGEILGATSPRGQLVSGGGPEDQQTVLRFDWRVLPTEDEVIR